MMWGLLIAACMGIFGGLFGIGSPLDVASRGMVHNENYRTEYDESYFSQGFQRNDESGTLSTVGQENTTSEEKPAAAVDPAPRSSVDVSLSSPTEIKGAGGNDGFTVLSGN